MSEKQQKTLHKEQQFTARSGQLITCGTITMNLTDRVVCRNGTSIHLAPLEYKLLVFFLQNPNKVHTREELLRVVWESQSSLATRTVDIHISSLRRKLHLEKNIRTVPTIGYMLRIP